VILVLLLLIDQVLKFLTLSSGLAFINKGIAFGLFSSANLSSFVIFVFILCALCYTICTSRRRLVLPLKLILVGGLSNLLDRIFHGGVVDYLYLPIIPSFNLADLAITIGFLLVVSHFIFWKNP